MQTVDVDVDVGAQLLLIIYRDGRLTVRLLMKYLVKKLGLEDESEV